MTGNGWELFGTTFSLLYTALAAAIFFVYIMLRSHGVTNISHFHLDGRAGDEGAD
jgi:hypothetical protein